MTNYSVRNNTAYFAATVLHPVPRPGALSAYQVLQLGAFHRGGQPNHEIVTSRGSQYL